MVGGKPAVAQHGAAIAKAEDLIEAVRDVDDHLAGGAQLADDPEQNFALLRGQRRGRLVERNDAGRRA
jgi:hypothetical protein